MVGKHSCFFLCDIQNVCKKRQAGGFSCGSLFIPVSALAFGKARNLYLSLFPQRAIYYPDVRIFSVPDLQKPTIREKMGVCVCRSGCGDVCDVLSCTKRNAGFPGLRRPLAEMVPKLGAVIEEKISVLVQCGLIDEHKVLFCG